MRDVLAAIRGAVRLLGLVGAALAVAACGSVSPARMVPAEAGAESGRKLPQRVRVMPVSGSRETFFGGPAFPKSEQYQEALIATLAKAGVFAEVSASVGDVALTTTLLSVSQEGFIPYTVRMVANYRFVSSDGTTLWSETYDSSFSAGNLGGATRTLNANEGAVRENLKALVQGIRERWRP